MNLEKIAKYLICRCGSELIIKENIFECKKCSKHYKIKDNKIYTTDQFINLNEWNHNEFKFDLFEREKKPNMPDVIGGPRLRDLVNTLEVDKTEDFLAFNLGGGQDKFDNVIKTTSFENMHKLEKKMGFGEGNTDEKTGKKIPFFNLGPKNDWKKLLNENT